jgi:plasmid stabilization system protein ParE
MVPKITWSALAVKTYLSNIEYLQKEWTQKEIDNFIVATERKLDLLKAQPHMGAVTHKRSNIRKTAIVKRILLVYRFQKRKGEIELLRFFNTWQHPNKMNTGEL